MEKIGFVNEKISKTALKPGQYLAIQLHSVSIALTLHIKRIKVINYIGYIGNSLYSFVNGFPQVTPDSYESHGWQTKVQCTVLYVISISLNVCVQKKIVSVTHARNFNGERRYGGND